MKQKSKTFLAIAICALLGSVMVVPSVKEALITKAETIDKNVSLTSGSAPSGWTLSGHVSKSGYVGFQSGATIKTANKTTLFEENTVLDPTKEVKFVSMNAATYGGAGLSGNFTASFLASGVVKDEITFNVNPTSSSNTLYTIDSSFNLSNLDETVDEFKLTSNSGSSSKFIRVYSFALSYSTKLESVLGPDIIVADPITIDFDTENSKEMSLHFESESGTVTDKRVATEILTGNDVISIDGTTITPLKGGTATVRVSSLSEKCLDVSDEFTVTVTSSLVHTGTVEDPYSVSDALVLTAKGSESSYYTIGRISSISEVSTTYGNATFILEDLNDPAKTIQAYRLNGFDNEQITDANIIKVGDIVTTYSQIKIQSSTARLASGYIYEIGNYEIESIQILRNGIDIGVSITLDVHESVNDVSLNILPLLASTNSVLWSSSDTSVVTVNNGVITSLDKEGYAIITCSSEENPLVFDSFTVNVVEVHRLVGVTVSGTLTNKEQYTGNDFDYTGLIFTLVHDLPKETPDIINGSLISWSELEDGQTSITGNYLGKTVTVDESFGLQVEEDFILALSYDGTPKVQAPNKVFDPTGLTFTLGWASGKEEVINPEHISFNPSLLTLDTTVVTAEYLGETVNIPVSVVLQTRFNFGEHEDFSSWDTNYNERTLDYSDFDMTFSGVNKQNASQPISTMPVSKGGTAYFETKNNLRIKSITFGFTQWNTKTQTIKLFKGTDISEESGIQLGDSLSFASDGTTISYTTASLDLTSLTVTMSSSSNQIGWEYVDVSFYSNKEYIAHYKDAFLHMNDYNDNLGYCADEEHHYYASAKEELIKMSNVQRLSLVEEISAYARLQAWALANGETIEIAETGEILPSTSGHINLNNDSSYVVLISLIGFTTIISTCYLIVRKRKQR